MSASTTTRSANWIKLVLTVLLLYGLYYSTFSWLIIKDWSRDDYSYGYLIPPILIYLIWTKRGSLTGLSSIPSWFGIIPLSIGIAFYWLGELSGEFFTLYFSFWLITVGLCWIVLGWEKLKTISFALIFALAMFPLPNFLHTKISVKLKLISSQIGVDMIQLYGLSAYREGNVIDLGFTQLQVVDACSGLRYLFPLLIMGILLVYFYKARFWKKVIVVISTVPLTIITNSLRIALTGILFETWGPRVAEGFFHGFSGWFIFMFGLAVIIFEMWALNGFRTFRSFGLLSSSKENSDIESDSAPQTSDFQFGSTEYDVSRTSNLRPPTGGLLKAILRPLQFVVAVILLAASLVLAQGVEFREKIPPNKSLSQFPLTIGQWIGKRESMEQRFINALDLSDYVIVDYKNSLGKQINFYTAYYESQRKGESIHSPATCLPGSGWTFNDAGTVRIPVTYKSNITMPVNRAYMLKNDYRQLSYYWFPQRGRILTNAYQLKLYAFWDALTRQRTDGALVRVITPVYKDENLENAEKRLQSFTRELVPELAKFLPD